MPERLEGHQRDGDFHRTLKEEGLGSMMDGLPRRKKAARDSPGNLDERREDGLHPTGIPQAKELELQNGQEG